MPPGLIEDQDGVRDVGSSGADFVEMQLHGFGVGVGHRQGCASVARWADRACRVQCTERPLHDLSTRRILVSPRGVQQSPGNYRH